MVVVVIGRTSTSWLIRDDDSYDGDGNGGVDFDGDRKMIIRLK